MEVCYYYAPRRRTATTNRYRTVTRDEINRRKIIAKSVLGTVLYSLRKIPRSESLAETCKDLEQFIMKHRTDLTVPHGIGVNRSNRRWKEKKDD